MFAQYEIPNAYSMVELAQQASKSAPQPFPEYMCYWIAFNNIYTTIAEREGYFAELQHQDDRPIRVRVNGNVSIPVIKMEHSELDEIKLAFTKFSESLKHNLIKHRNTRFFVERIPIWHGEKIEIDERGQRVNGVINVKYTTDPKNPIWSPVDFDAYERFEQKKATPDDVNHLAWQLLMLIYTVRNNTFHGGKRVDDDNDRLVIEMALPLLKMIVEFFIPQRANNAYAG